MDDQPNPKEPWLRGPIARGVGAFVAPLLYSFQMAREDLAKYTAGLTTEQIWATPHGFGSVGFHLRHIAGSTDRLMTYVSGGQLSGDQMAALKTEKEPGATREKLLAGIDQASQTRKPSRAPSIPRASPILAASAASNCPPPSSDFWSTSPNTPSATSARRSAPQNCRVRMTLDRQRNATQPQMPIGGPARARSSSPA